MLNLRDWIIHLMAIIALQYHILCMAWKAKRRRIHLLGWTKADNMKEKRAKEQIEECEE